MPSAFDSASCSLLLTYGARTSARRSGCLWDSSTGAHSGARRRYFFHLLNLLSLFRPPSTLDALVQSGFYLRVFLLPPKCVRNIKTLLLLPPPTPHPFFFLPQEKIKRIQQIRMEKELRAQQILEVGNLIQRHL